MKNVVLSVALNDSSINLLKSLKGSELINNAHVHLVHCFEIHLYASDFTPFVFPGEDKYPEIESATKVILKNLAEELGIKSFTTEVFFSSTPKKKMIDYLKEKKTELIIVATRGKHGIEGLFSSSFAEHLLKFSPCDVHILRPRDDQ